jgi:hypothetical protein
MRVVIFLTAAVLLAGLAQVGSAGPSGKEPGQELVTLEQKMLGTWEGSTPCDGTLVFRGEPERQIPSRRQLPYGAACGAARRPARPLRSRAILQEAWTPARKKPGCSAWRELAIGP